MPVVVSMLRAVNLGSYHRIKMDDLRAMYELLKLREVRTYVQSGNVVFKTQERDITRLAARIEKEIERTFGFHSDVVARTTDEMREVVARNPFTKRRGVDPSKLLVTFLRRDPGEPAREKVRSIKTSPEELHIDGCELYVYYPNGVGRSKLPSSLLERTLDTPGTARNWNSVTKLLDMAENLESVRR